MQNGVGGVAHDRITALPSEFAQVFFAFILRTLVLKVSKHLKPIKTPKRSKEIHSPKL